MWSSCGFLKTKTLQEKKTIEIITKYADGFLLPQKCTLRLINFFYKYKTTSDCKGTYRGLLCEMSIEILQESSGIFFWCDTTYSFRVIAHKALHSSFQYLPCRPWLQKVDQSQVVDCPISPPCPMHNRK